MWDATPSNFGAYALQDHEMEVFYAMCAAAANRYNIDPLDSDYTRTHAEWAIIDGYFPERWDFTRLKASNAPLTVEEATATAQGVRHKINDYKIEIKKCL
jgi:hypothetical protein